MKYAIIESGGKQFTAEEGKIIEVDHLPVEVNQKVKFDSVLLLVDEEKILVGTPTVKGALVNTTVVSHDKGPKLTIFKYIAKKRRRVKTGHRQTYTQLKVDSIKKE